MKPLIFLFFWSASAFSEATMTIPLQESVDDPISNAIIKALEELQQCIQNGIPEMGIPPLDPFQKDEMNIDIQKDELSLKLELTDVDFVGLSNYTVDKAKANLLRLSVDIEVTLPGLSLDSNYDLDVLIAELIPVYGQGSMSLFIGHIKGSLFVQISIDTNDFVNIKDADLSIVIESIKLGTDGLLGGNDLEDVIDQFIDIVGPNLINFIVDVAKDKIMDKMVTYINDHVLFNVTLDDIIDLMADFTCADAEIKERNSIVETPARSFTDGDTGNTDIFLDAILANLRDFIIDKDLDPVSLPDVDETLHIELPFGIELTAGVELTEGQLEGLATVHRTGEATLAIDGNDLTLKAEIGVDNIKVEYQLYAEIFGIGPTISADATIEDTSIQLEARISGDNLLVQITTFEVKEIGNINIDTSGLGPLDWILDPFLEFFSNLLKNQVMRVVENDVKNAINEKLSGFHLPDTLHLYTS